jgi:hypothetical protein
MLTEAGILALTGGALGVALATRGIERPPARRC